MAGMQVVVVDCDEKGNVNVDDLRKKAEDNSDNLAAFMITYPRLTEYLKSPLLKWQNNSFKWRTCVHGWRKYECSGGTYESGIYRG